MILFLITLYGWTSRGSEVERNVHLTDIVLPVYRAKIRIGIVGWSQFWNLQVSSRYIILRKKSFHFIINKFVLSLLY